MENKEKIPLTAVSISLSDKTGKVKLMNCVNNGPSKPRSDQSRGNFEDYRALSIPYARIHDANWCPAYGAPHTVDITAVFPDFGAPADDPASYDFTHTDIYLKTMADAGTKVFFRLGQSIEHNPKKYGIMPPADNKKWAQICEHIIRHYNEGWAGGFRYGIEYWEIWNEPDLGVPLPDGVAGDPKTWGGTAKEFFDLYEVAAKHLKGLFPHLKIGGPAIAGNFEWAEAFFAHLCATKTPMDFFSWHIYATKPEDISARCRLARELMDKYGFSGAESILNEWNYVKDWSPSWVYSLEAECGKEHLKSAAFIASTMIECQKAPLDMLMYYDARIGTAMNGMFDFVSLEPLKGYYPFYAWKKLAALGNAVQTDVSWVPMDVPHGGDVPACDVYALAASSSDGKRGAVFVSRYSDDNNVVWKRKVRITADAPVFSGTVSCHMTDAFRSHTEVEAELEDGASLSITLAPRSFALLEWSI